MSYDDEQDDWADEYGDSSEPSTITCSECGSEVYDDAIRCPICNNYITATSSSRVKMHWRFVALLLLVIGIAWVINRINALLAN